MSADQSYLKSPVELEQAPDNLAWLLGIPEISTQKIAKIEDKETFVQGAVNLALSEWQALPVVLRNLLGSLNEAEITQYEDILRPALDRKAGFDVLSDIQMQLAQKLVQDLDQANIDYCFIKGTAARLSGYGDPSMRLGKDLDIAVRKGDLRIAEEVAIANGFLPAEWCYNTRHFYFPNLSARRAVEKNHYELGFLARRQSVLEIDLGIEQMIRRDIPNQYIWHELPDGQLCCYVTVDIHHSISLDIPAEPSLNHKSSTVVEGQEISIPPIEWLLFQIIFKLYWEGVHNYRKGAYQYSDVARLIPLLTASDFGRFEKILQNYKFEAGAYYVLRRIKLNLFHSVPDFVNEFLIEQSNSPSKGVPEDFNDFGDHWPKIWGIR